MNKISSQEDLINKIILHRNDLKGENKKIAICGVAYEGTSVMKVTPYPVNLKGKIYNTSIRLSKQKMSDKNLEEVADWYLIKEASRVEREVMERINC